MKPEYKIWLKEQKYSENTQISQLHRVKKVEEHYGSLDVHATNGTYPDVISTLEYSAGDERANKPNPSKIKFNGNIRNNLQSYKNAVVRYQKFLNDNGFKRDISEINRPTEGVELTEDSEESIKQRLSLERDMQAALRENIASLDAELRIIDDGAERAVDSGFIDITCEDNDGIVVVELKAGKTNSSAIGQILGYMGDIQKEEEGGKPVRGILVAHEFDRRTKAAACVVPTLTLKKYSIEFKFAEEK